MLAVVRPSCGSVGAILGSALAVFAQLPGVSVQRRVQEKTTEVGVLREPCPFRARRKKGHPEVQDVQMMPNRARVLGKKRRTGREGWGVRRRMGGRRIEEEEEEAEEDVEEDEDEAGEENEEGDEVEVEEEGEGRRRGTQREGSGLWVMD